MPAKPKRAEAKRPKRGAVTGVSAKAAFKAKSRKARAARKKASRPGSPT